MKKVLFLAALVLGIASCQKDFTAENESRGEVSVQLSVAAPELIGATRTDGDAQNHLNSAYGAIDYLDGAPAGDDRWDWDNVDLRYSMEVYDETELTTPIKDRMVIIKDKYEPVTFELRLIPGRDYRFVVFADFVPQGEAAKTVDYSVQGNLGLRHTIGANLTDITIKQDVDDINDEIADAYFKAFTYTPSNTSANKADDVVLQRPYAKVRVVATDLADLNLNVQPKYVAITYSTNTVVPTTFNAVTGEISEAKSEAGKYFDDVYVDGIRENRVNHVYNYGYDDDTVVADNGIERASSLTLFTDYILAVDDHTPISFQMTVFDQNNAPIKTVDFNTNIPIQRNHLTTIVGNLMTANTEFTVTIDDDFANADELEKEPWYIEVWDGKTQTEPEIVTDSTTGETVAVVDQPSDLAWLAAYVNGTLATRSGNDEAINIVLAADIDLGNMPWTPIGSATAEHGYMGNFDGNGKTIKNLCITNVALDADNYAYAGLFGVTEGTPENHNWIKDLTIENVTISTEGHIVAAAVAYPYYTDIENITVKGNVAIKGGDYTSGVLAYTRRCVNAKNISIEANEGSVIEGNITVGGVISDIQMNGGLTANYSNFAASGVTIKGVKNVGGISGIIGAQNLDGAIVKNVTIVSDDIHTGMISGSFDGHSVITNAVVENVTGADSYIGCLYSGTASDRSSVTINGDVYTYNNGWIVNGCKVIADGVILNEAGEYIISNAAGMFWFANEVNVNKNAFNGNTVKLADDIDLENAAWTPVGQTGATTFNGVFDGQNYTIYNLNVNSEAQTGEHYSSGLFGWVESHTAGRGHLKNVKINGATINGHHNCGALVGYITQETALVENCHVTGATVTCTKANNDADGDKAGALIGNATVATPVKDCTAANSTVSAGRDAGQVIGAGKEANVTGCSANEVTVSANGTSTGANVRNEVIGRLL